VDIKNNATKHEANNTQMQEKNMQEESFSAKPQKKKMSKKAKILWSLFAFFMLAPLLIPVDEKDASSAKPAAVVAQNESANKEVQAVVPAKKKTLPWTPTDVLYRYHTIALDMKLPIARLVDGPDKGVSRYTLTPFSTAVFMCNKNDGKITGIFFVIGGDGSQVAADTMASSIVAMIAASTPDYTRENRAYIMKKLGFFNSTFLDGTERTIDTHVAKISASYSETLGLIIAVNPLE